MPFGYTPFMNMQQGIDYYSQFANPTFGNAAVEESQQQDQSSVADDVLGQEENLGTLIDPRGGRGPEDRGSFADRFGTAEDQGYGYSGTPGEGGSGTFKNPAFGDYGDTFTPGPGIGDAYDPYGRLRDIGIFNDLGLNLYDAAYPFATDPVGSFANLFRNRQEEEAYDKTTLAETTKMLQDNYAKQQKQEAEAAAAAREAAARETELANAAEAAAAREKLKQAASYKQYTGGRGAKIGSLGAGGGQRRSAGLSGSGSGAGKGGLGAGGQKGKNKGTARF